MTCISCKYKDRFVSIRRLLAQKDCQLLIWSLVRFDKLKFSIFHGPERFPEISISLGLTIDTYDLYVTKFEVDNSSIFTYLRRDWTPWKNTFQDKTQRTKNHCIKADLVTQQLYMAVSQCQAVQEPLNLNKTFFKVFLDWYPLKSFICSQSTALIKKSI